MSMSTFFGGFDMFVLVKCSLQTLASGEERSAGTALKRVKSCTMRQPEADFIFQTKDEKK